MIGDVFTHCIGQLGVGRCTIGSRFKLRGQIQSNFDILPSGGERFEAHSVTFLAWDSVATTTQKSFRERWRLESSGVWGTASTRLERVSEGASKFLSR